MSELPKRELLLEKEDIYITSGFVGENGIDIYMIDIAYDSRMLFRMSKEVTFYTLTGQRKFEPERTVEDIDSVFLFVTTHSGSDYAINIISGTLEIGTLDDNKRIYFKIDQYDNIKILKLFVPI